MNGSALLSIGDPIPDIRLANQAGDAVSFQHQSVAGSPAILFLCPSRIENDITQSPAAALVAAAGAFAALSAHIFVVSPSGIESHRQIARQLPPNMQLLSDPVRKMLDAFGQLTAPRLVVLRPNMRVAAILDGDGALEDALAICGAFLPAESPVVALQAPVLIVDHIFTPAFCASLIAVWSRGEKNENRLASDDSRTARAEVAVVDSFVNRDIQSYFASRLLSELAKAFRFQVTGFERNRVVSYSPSRSEQFRRLGEMGSAQSRKRAFVLTLNLNDDYDGGESLFPEYGHGRYRAGIGAGLVFSSALLHQAAPVTKGQKFALVTFFYGRALDMS
jgi:peroxiredoxin